jgi:hypothetical protein
MRLTTPAAMLATSLVFAGSLNAQDSPGLLLLVSANTDVYQAGGNKDNSGGVSPYPYVFPAAPGQVLTFSAIVGKWTCADPAGAPYGPDGTSNAAETACYPRASISNPIGAFSGYYTTDFTGALAGVFLEDTLPASAPPPLRFYVSDSSQGGIQTDFATLSPLIGQVFFIGDGLTGTGTGSVQTFQVPATATHLYLGYVDSCSATGMTSPGCYGDNGSALAAVFRLSQASN